jgi:hypothetical protein
MEQTVMVFADAAARTTALTGVVSEGMLSYLKSTKQVEVYNGSAWVASDDPNAIQNTIVDAKGDLIAATANDTPARLAVGSNGETLVADSAASTGLRYNPPVGSLANPVINGGFDIWQRGTSFLNPANGYTADRWLGSSATAGTVSRQTVSDSTNLPNIQFAARYQRTNGSTSTIDLNLVQNWETSNSIPFAGKTVTLSFYARAGANFSAASSVLIARLYSGTGTDQNWYLSGFTNQATPISQNATLTTTWQRFAFTGTIASNVTQLGIGFITTPTGTAGANDWYEITGVQLDVGTWTASTAPTFRRSGGTLQGELAACQRYYFRTNNAGSNYQPFGTGIGRTTTNADLYIQFPVTMRTAPTSLDFSNLMLWDGTNTTAITSITLFANNTGNFATLLNANTTATTLVQYRAYQILSNNSSTAHIGFSAEL